MYLLDTNVVSELRKIGIGKADPKVTAWAQRTPTSRLWLSAISILELEIGVLRIERRDERQGAILRGWMLEQVLPSFEGRTLPVDSRIARHCARLHVPDPRSARDALIAATALVHDLVVITRNIADFGPMGVELENPWD